MQRAILFMLMAIVLSACDSYIEEARVMPDGTVEFVASATVVCSDDLQEAIWGGDPCERLDSAVRTGDFGVLPLDVDLDPNRVSVVGSGEQDRRTIEAAWSGQPEELSSLLVSGAEIQVLDEFRSEVVFSTAGTAFERLEQSNDPAIVDGLRRSRWDPAEFRIRAPDVISDHNADRLQGRFAIWEIDGDHPSEFRVEWSSEGPARHLWWWALSAVIVLIVLVMMVVIEGPAAAKAKAERQRDSVDQKADGQREEERSEAK